MGIYTQSQQLKFFFDPARVAGNNQIKLYKWANLCTVDLRLKEPARLIKFSAFAHIPNNLDSVVGSKQVREFGIWRWTASGRWQSPTNQTIFLNTCAFNCPLNFAALSVITQENWFLTNDYPIYERECFYMGGFTIEDVNVNFSDVVDITPVPNPPFQDRFLFIDIRFTIEYEVFN